MINKVNSPAFFDDNHIENIKNLETYDFSMLATIPAAAHATKRNRVIIPDDDGNLREFIILETAQRDKKKRIKTVASYIELKKSKRISPAVLESQTVNMGLDWTLAGTGWQRGITEYAGIRKVTIDGYKDPYQVLKQLASLYELELRFRIVVDGSRIVGRYVDMIKRRGEDTKKETRLGKDLIGVERTENMDIVTALRVLGPELEDGTRLIVEVKNEEARQRWARDGQHLWEDYEPSISEENVSVERLTELGEAQLAKRINTTVQYTADVVSMEEIFGYTHEKVRLGDANRIKDTSYSPPLYLEARVIEIHRSISAGKVKRKYVLGDFIEYAEEDLMKTFLQLQQIYGAKVIRSDTPPPIPKAGMIWVDTSGERDVIYTWNATTRQWDKATPTHAEEVGAYDKETVDQKDQSVYDDSTGYTDIVSEEKKQEAINHTNTEVQKRELAIIRQDTEPTGSNYAVGQLWLRTTDDVYFKWTGASWKQLTPSLAEVGAKAGLDYVNGELNAKASIEALASKADLEYVDGQLVSKANKSETYTISEIDNALDSKVSILTYTTDQNGVVQRLESAESRITQSETEITSKVSNTVYLADKNNLQGQIDEKADQTAVNGISSRLTTAESTITQQANEIASKVSQTTYDTDRNGIVTRLNTAESTLTQHASQIASKVSQTDFNSLSGRVSTAESSITQQAGLIEQRVTKTEFENLSFGGRNLLLDSKVQANTTSYLVRQYILSEDFITGQQYTFVIKGSVPDGQRFGIWQNGGNTSRGYATEIYSDGVTYVTFTAAATTAGNERRLSLYNFPSNTTRATVEWVALYKGNKPFDWTPAPEDVDGAISGLGSRISTAESSITQQANAINLRVKTEDYTIDQNALKSRVSTAESTITQHANAISLRVEKDGVISSINQSPESIRIAASKIHIDGSVTFASGYNPTEKETPTGAQSKADGAEQRAKELATAMTSGLMLYTDPTFKKSNNSVLVYNNSGGSGVTINRIAAPADAPTDSTHILEVTHSVDATSPNHGGFTFRTNTRANATFIVRFIAKLEVGRSFAFATNATGTGGTNKWLTSNVGTGNYEEYIYKVQCGSSGSFSSTNFFSVVGGSRPFTWQLAYATVFDITAGDLASSWVFGNTTSIDGGNIYTNTVNANVLRSGSVIANDITFTGILQGATGTFSGTVSASELRVNNPSITSTGGTLLLLESGFLNSSGSTYTSDGHIQISSFNQDLIFTHHTAGKKIRSIIMDGGVDMTGGARVNNDLNVGGWIRAEGTTGLLFHNYGGGFNMTDSTWIRTYGGKSFYMASGTMRTDGTLQVTSSSSTGLLADSTGLYVNNIKGRSNANIVNIGNNLQINTVNADVRIMTDASNFISQGVNSLHFVQNGLWVTSLTIKEPGTNNHVFMRLGNAGIKGLGTTAGKVQIRLFDDTDYGDVQLNLLQYRSMSQFSRREFKKNITDAYLDGEGLINSLNFREFLYNEQPDNARKLLGLILEETDKYLHDPTGDGIDISRLLYVVAIAIQQLSKRDKELHDEVELWKEKVASLQRQMAA